jgi:hypothetical protein
MIIRYRRNIIASDWIVPYAEYTKEIWEKTGKDSPMGVGKRLINSSDETYKGPLKDYELMAIEDGWTPPDSFTYLNILPENCEILDEK